MTRTPNTPPPEGLSSTLGHTFTNETLLKTALTHPSLEGEDNYQRLEFLGDRVLGMVIGALLYQKYPGDREGNLSRRQTALVRKETLAEVARNLKLGRYIRMTETTVRGGGRTNPSILSDVIEALIGALYLEAGAAVAEAFIKKNWGPYLSADVVKKDSKTDLQEWAQGRGLALPEYEEIKKTGPDHAPKFVVEVTVDGAGSAQAEGASKQAAEILAARDLLNKMTAKKKSKK
jgi:ribonuclease-3